MTEKIVGHKTFRTDDGGFRHEPLTESEAAGLWAACEAEKAKRATDMPTEQDAIKAMFSAWRRLKELGWKEAIYCPKDGSHFLAIEPGSTGIFDCSYEGEWPKGSWWCYVDNDAYPSRPTLFKLTGETK